MIVVEIRAGEGGTVSLHPAVTVVAGLDPSERTRWAEGIAAALRGERGPFVVEAEIDGTRRALTPEIASSLGVGDAASAVAVLAADLPGAKRRDATAGGPADDGADEADAEADVARLSAEVEAARRAAAAADAARGAAPEDTSATAGLVDVDERLAEARAATAEARLRLSEAERADARGAAAAEAVSALDALRREAAALEAERAEVLRRMIEAGEPGDPAPVEGALDAIERLRQVRPRPSEAGATLADRWAGVLERLATVPPASQPPAWLVAPALAALQQARDDLARAEAGGDPAQLDPVGVEVLERAHRNVLEAEQRAMRKGSRINRRRLDAAHAAEQVALHALGLRSYGEFLQGPPSTGAPRSDEQVEAARAALADAEAVWEELHGGDAPPEWTAAKEEQAALRREAIALLGREVDDDELEAALRSHLEALVDTGWAEQSLATALAGAGVDLHEGDDAEEVARRWLAESQDRREARARAEADLAAVDARLAAVEQERSAHQADAFFGDEDGGAADDAAAAPEEVDDARRRLEEAEAREREAAEAATAARQQARHAERERAAGADADAERAAAALDDLTAALQRAQDDLATRRASRPPSPAPEPDVDLSAVIGMEAEAYLLARASALRGAPGGPLPLVVDGAAVTGLSDGAARRVLRLLGRVAESVQVVVVGDDEKISTWAGGLGDRAAVRRVSR